MAPVVYLVSGANRGIGLGLVTQLAIRDDVLVFAGARNPSAASDLHALSEKHPGKIYIVKLTSADKADNEAAVAKIKELAGRLDVVIANAGICNYIGPALETPAEEMREHYEVNVIGTLILFQATYPLLQASTSSPKFIPISSGAGSISHGAKFFTPVLAYGASKAAENYLAVKLHTEHPGLICFPISPGGVATDLAARAIQGDDRLKDYPFITVELAASQILERVDKGGREEEDFVMAHNGENMPW